MPTRDYPPPYKDRRGQGALFSLAAWMVLQTAGRRKPRRQLYRATISAKQIEISLLHPLTAARLPARCHHHYLLPASRASRCFLHSFPTASQPCCPLSFRQRILSHWFDTMVAISWDSANYLHLLTCRHPMLLTSSRLTQRAIQTVTGQQACRFGVISPIAVDHSACHTCRHVCRRQPVVLRLPQLLARACLRIGGNVP